MYRKREFIIHLLSTVLLFEAYVFKTSRADDYNPQFETPARIITNLEIIYGSHGVPVLYYYNETTLKNDTHLGSVPGCPKSIDGFPWIYYGNPPRCFLAGHYGPCPIAQKLMVQQGSPYGACACECLQDNDYSKQLRNPYIRFVFCQKFDTESAEFGQIYDKEENQCYNHYTQGPCSLGSIIANYSDTSLTCTPACDKNKENWYSDQRKGLCATTPILPVTGTSDILTLSDCRAGERYSETLRKCVKIAGSFSVG